MVLYYILCATSNCHANDWWEGNYARIMYPKADLTSQRISDFLIDIGEEGALRRFFKAYLPTLSGSKDSFNILIDSTGIPNSFHFPLTAISNHNGKIGNEVRLIYVTQQETGLPIFFRYCTGNVVDVSSLIRTVNELEAHGVSTKLAVLDAPYYSDSDIQELYDSGISFVTRLKENKRIFKDLIVQRVPNIECNQNFVGYNGRYVYIKRAKCELIEGYKAYAYIGIDIEIRSNEYKRFFSQAKNKEYSDEIVYEHLKGLGKFIIVSSYRMPYNEISPMCHTRQQI
ncbi:MAG: transposase [Deltaproteobacteria bacterium]|nr:transposase [Deltaproteobacteria bacterium]